jgi:hypothetical protein
MLQSTIRIVDRQGAVPEPSLETRMRAWQNARLPQRLEAAKPVQLDLLNVRLWRRNSRVTYTQRILDRISRSHTATLAMAIGVTPRAVRYWRAGAVAPTSEHARQLTALSALLVATRQYALSHS